MSVDPSVIFLNGMRGEAISEGSSCNARISCKV